MHINLTRISITILSSILSLFAIMAVGCTARYVEPNPELEPAAAPQYIEGTTFVYSNGSWETVVSASPEKVTWKNHRGFVSAGSPDFTYRRFEWQSRKRRGERSISPRSDISRRPPASLWPLQKGKKAGFREDGQWQDIAGVEKSYASIWSCGVAGTETVSVLAGDFDTWKIDCKRYSVNRFGAASRVKEVKTWYFSPDIGHPVLTTSRYTYDRPSKRRELMAVLPPDGELPPAARTKMVLSLQKSLESNKSGKPLHWELAGQGLSGKTEPRDTFQLKNGAFCRRYVQEVRMVEEKYKYYGMACRSSGGEWYTPRKKYPGRGVLQR